MLRFLNKRFAGTSRWQSQVLSLVLVFVFLGCGSFQPQYRSSYRSGSGDFHSPEFDGPGPYQPGSPHNYASPFRAPDRGPLRLMWPVERVKITQKFANPKNPYHEGIDLGGRKYSPIYAAHEGVVVYAGTGFRGYGKMVLLEFSKDWATLYAHLNRIDVKEGDTLLAGQVIGRMGQTGRATGVHLHFELLKNKRPLNPLNFLPKKRLYSRK